MSQGDDGRGHVAGPLPSAECLAEHHRRCSRAPAVRFAEGGYAKELSNCVSSHHGSVIVVFACLLNLINREMFSCGNKLLFGEHKHTIAAVIKLQPGERNIRILFHKMYHAVADFTNQHAIISKVICRVTENATRQFQPSVPDARPSSGSWRYSFGSRTYLPHRHTAG